MLAVYNCVTNAHDLRLVALATIICALASFTAFTLLHHVRKSTGRMRRVWLTVSIVATGFGIWATHFIAMIAFSPGLPSGFNIPVSMLSLLGAIVLTGAGFFVALSAPLPGAAALGGMIAGGGITVMHYTGMTAYEVQGRLVWDPVLVISSIALGEVFGALALRTGMHGISLKWRIYGALLLTVGICIDHFTAMGAISIVPDPTIAVSPSTVPPSWLAVGVALASLTIIACAVVGLVLDIRDRRRFDREAERMRGLADAAVEGLIVCKDDVITTANRSFAALAASVDEVVGKTLDTYFPDETIRAKLVARPDRPIETALHRHDGTTIPVEMFLRFIDFAGQPHRAIAIRDLSARKEAEEHIRFLAHHDTLTGLPNRSTFYRRLDQEIEEARVSDQYLAVLLLDLDHLKEVNDLFGHATGDKMLQTLAKIVRGLLGPNQMIARIGGDEFAIILPALPSPIFAGRAAWNIVDALKAGSEQSPTSALISASIGIAICPNDATERTLLLSHADMALYRAKTEARGTYRFFDATLAKDVHDRRLLECDLRQAISRGELSLVYQPQMDIETNQIVGFEALLRWKHETRGQIPPSEFIPVAEESGTILQIGEWVLRTACSEAAGWTAPLIVAVNVSTIQLHNSGFARQVHEILLETGTPPHRLELEITETALIRDLNRALLTLRQLKALGVRISIDDFGTGYSSLSNLRAFPFDKIKIDQSLIKSVDKDGHAATIVRAVLGLSRGLGLPVLAEGVETRGELEFLSDERCNEIQGYLLSRPAVIENFRHLTNARSDDEPRAPSIAASNDQMLRVVGE